ncbi:hypothetical protein EDEG_00683 [Edhazardia aedis USNM 41457]|uniref:HhH-GPD domain-containing protein n=1 Tax=Edhazardia aedis (strain USNM 41457) TaxID=1003232 RepID=J8ZZZ5_EDHAE|nr:hypothetical protein EDEG_00683 [Edhazardia aedis USNM 41457]|eukprot:EJW05218.1 hypothetical protein EDEG_00683 [Edhazardia aedis USNM 41457]
MHEFAQNYKGLSMPTKIDELLKIKGVGKKMAFLYMNYCFNQSFGIAVDTHVHRLSQRLGFTSSKNVEICRKDLEKLFHISQWNDVNFVLVGFGQVICTAINPKCAICNARFICPSSNVVEW